MFYLKASLIISAVSALPLSQFKARQTNALVPPELIPQTCSWQCGPVLAVPDNCAQGDSGCACTASIANSLQYCLNCFWTQSSQTSANGSWMSAAIGWANDYNLQCREAGFTLPPVVAGGDELNAVTSGAPAGGIPAVPRVGSPNANTPPPAPAVPSATPTPTLTPAPSTPSSTPPSAPTPTSSTSLTQASVSTPAPTPSPAPTLSASGLGSTFNLGSQTITIVGSSVPVNIPANNASDSSADAAAAAAAANAAHKSIIDVWIAIIVGTVSVAAAVMF